MAKESELNFALTLSKITAEACIFLQKIANKKSQDKNDFINAWKLLCKLENAYYSSMNSPEEASVILMHLSTCWAAFGDIHKAEILKKYCEKGKPVLLCLDPPRLMLTSLKELEIQSDMQTLLKSLYASAVNGILEDIEVSKKVFKETYAGIADLKSIEFWSWVKFGYYYKVSGAKTCINNIFKAISARQDLDPNGIPSTGYDMFAIAYKLCNEAVPGDAPNVEAIRSYVTKETMEYSPGSPKASLINLKSPPTSPSIDDKSFSLSTVSSSSRDSKESLVTSALGMLHSTDENI